MSKTYECTLTVRGYELDSFGHVNHAVYLSYLEHARWELLAAENVTLKTLAEWKAWPVIAQLEAKYLKPTYLGDTLTIRTRVVDMGRVHFSFEQELYRGNELVFKAKLQAVMVNESGRPTAIPEPLAARWSSISSSST